MQGTRILLETVCLPRSKAVGCHRKVCMSDLLSLIAGMWVCEKMEGEVSI